MICSGVEESDAHLISTPPLQHRHEHTVASGNPRWVGGAFGELLGTQTTKGMIMGCFTELLCSHRSWPPNWV